MGFPSAGRGLRRNVPPGDVISEPPASPSPNSDTNALPRKSSHQIQTLPFIELFIYCTSVVSGVINVASRRAERSFCSRGIGAWQRKRNDTAPGRLMTSEIMKRMLLLLRRSVANCIEEVFPCCMPQSLTRFTGMINGCIED